MSEQADKLKRLLALALNGSAADGEALNAIKAARKIVSELGGVDKAIAAIGGGSAAVDSCYGPFEWAYQPNPFNSSGDSDFTEAIRKMREYLYGRQNKSRREWKGEGK